MHILLLLMLLSQATYGILKIQKYCTEEWYDTLMKMATEWWKLLWNPSECIKNVLKTVKVAREFWSIKSSKKIWSISMDYLENASFPRMDCWYMSASVTICGRQTCLLCHSVSVSGILKWKSVEAYIGLIRDLGFDVESRDQ